MTLIADRRKFVKDYLFVFVFFFIINLMASGGHIDMWDGMVTFMITESMALKQTAQLHPEIPSISLANPSDMVHTMMDYEVGNYKVLTGKYYDWVSSLKPLEPVFSSRSLLLPAIAVPAYLLASLLSLNPVSVIGISVNSLIISLTSLVIFCFSLDLYGSRRIAFILGLVFVGCSFILPYNNTLFPQPLQGLCIITAAFFLYKSRHYNHSFICIYTRHENYNNKRGIIYGGLAALFLGMSVLASPASAMFIPAFIICAFLYTRHNRKIIACFILTLAIILFSAGVVNYLRFGSFTEFGYGGAYGTFSYNQGWTGLVGLWASPGKGLIFYFPAVLLLPLALNLVYRQDKAFFILTTYIVIISWLYFGTLVANNESRFWSGAIAWGPRYLIPLLPFITIALGALITRRRNTRTKSLLTMKASLVTVCVAGFIVNLPGTLVWSEYGTIYAWDKEKLGNSALEIVTWNPNYSPIILHLKILYEGYLSDIPVDDYRYSAWYYAAYGLAPCQVDMYIFCKLGMIPVLILAGIAIVISVIVIKTSRKDVYVYS
ncbi:MAG: hypothetical protein QN720_06560 [Nitrososphaeraceae archaeon]|nr:hypothetical protein [Nitrososphaeraceae archaeon]MDW0332614.1 hypothetical protein [Nitrososphaeraceae archaeon]